MGIDMPMAIEMESDLCQPQSKDQGFGFFRLGLDLGPVGTGDWDLDFGLTINGQ